MRDEPRQVTTFCPRCGRPILWSFRAGATGRAWVELQRVGCACALSAGQWADLVGRALAARAGRDDDDRGVRRVREDDPA